MVTFLSIKLVSAMHLCNFSSLDDESRLRQTTGLFGREIGRRKERRDLDIANDASISAIAQSRSRNWTWEFLIA
jgi:hypothetical protein